MKNIKIKFPSITLYFILIALLCGFIKYTLYILFIVIFHELGHVFIIKILGYDVESINIYPFGGITKISKMVNDSVIKDLLIAIFGIVFQLIIFLLCKINVLTDPFIYKANITIMLFNLLPIIPLDGSKIVLELLHKIMPFKKAVKYYTYISIIGIVIFFIYNLEYNLNVFLLLGLFIYQTILNYQNQDYLFNKFILERMLYNIDFNYVDNNKKVSDYKKDTKYYYFQDNKLIDEKKYLLKNKSY